MQCQFPTIFEARSFSLDPYWQDLLEQCSQGKFPRGVKPSRENSLAIFSGTKSREIIALSSDPLETFKTMMDIFKNKLGLTSDRDQHRQRNELIELRTRLKLDTECTWKSIKNKRLRNKILLNFVLTCQTKYHLTASETTQLFSLLHLGLTFKSITSNDIDYRDGVIHSIAGLDFDADGAFSIDIFASSSDKIDKSLIDANRITTLIERYVKEYKNQCVSLKN